MNANINHKSLISGFGNADFLSALWRRFGQQSSWKKDVFVPKIENLHQSQLARISKNASFCLLTNSDQTQRKWEIAAALQFQGRQKIVIFFYEDGNPRRWDKENTWRKRPINFLCRKDLPKRPQEDYDGDSKVKETREKLIPKIPN